MKEKKESNEEPTHNYICIGVFEVSSSTATLKELEDCINRLIEKHKDFLKLNVTSSIVD